jgi:hypothetical protein
MIFIYRIPKWKNISVAKYQSINEINQSDLDDIDKMLFTITELLNSTEDKIDKISSFTFLRLQKQLEKRLKYIEKQLDFEEYIKGFTFTKNANEITLGQYIEIQHFLKGDYINNLHLIGASISKCKKLNHVERANKILELPVLNIIWNIYHFLESFKDFNLNYKGLFGIEDIEDEEYLPVSNGFNAKYGWIYSAKKIADFENITLEQSFDLPITQAFNDLSYLKEYQNYENEISKRQIKQI